MTIVDQLKAAIRDSGWTSYRLWEESGVSVGVIDRLMAGKRDVRLETAAKLCLALRLELRKVG